MSQLLIAVFSFLNSDAGQSVVKAASATVIQAIGGLISLAHHHVLSNTPPPEPEK